MPNLGMSRFISLTKLSSAALFHKNFDSHYSNLNFTYEEDYNSFSTTQKKKLVGYIWIWQRLGLISDNRFISVDAA